MGMEAPCDEQTYVEVNMREILHMRSTKLMP